MYTIKPLPDINTLFEFFSYDPIVGILMRKKLRGAGKPAGTKSSRKDGRHGAIKVYVGRDCFAAHRIIYKMMTGREPSALIDHRDCDPWNNVWKNIRDANTNGNATNRKLTRNNLTGLKGVHYRKDKKTYRATIEHLGKRYNLGDFHTAEEAHAAYCGAGKILHGAFFRHG